MSRREKILAKIHELHNQNLQKNRDLVGKPTHPSREDSITYWKSRINSREPRSFYYVFDIGQNKTTLCKGLEIIGKDDTYGLTYFDIYNLYHENHQLTNLYQMLGLHNMFLDFRGEVDNWDVYYTSLRALKDKNGKCWYARYLANCFQFDENGYLVSYLSRWSLLSEYKGQGIFSEFFYEGNDLKTYEPVIKKLNYRLELNKAETLKFLGFTRLQREVLKYWMFENSSIKSIAENMEISESGVAFHNSNIIEIAKEVFPINDFKSAIDVALYLSKQNFI